jgi:hypothetical protein
MSDRLCNLCELAAMRRREPGQEFVVEPEPEPHFPKAVRVSRQPSGRPDQRSFVVWFAELPESCRC